jgi:hypothetical protein
MANDKLSIEDIDALMKELGDSPKHQKIAEILGKLRSPQYQDILSKVGSATRGVTALAGISEGISQKRSGKRAIEALQEPAIPGSARVDPALSRLIGSAEAKATSPERYGAIGAYQQQLGRAYQTGLGQARTASGGQSGSYGAQGQALYNQRLNQASKLPAMTSQIAQQYEGMAGNLAAQKAQADSYAYMNNLDRARVQLGQYNTDAEAAANLYRTGSQNIYGGMNYGLDALQEPLSDVLYNNLPSTGIQELDDQAGSITGSMNSRFRVDPYQMQPPLRVDPYQMQPPLIQPQVPYGAEVDIPNTPDYGYGFN